MLKKKRKKKGSNIGSCPQVPVFQTEEYLIFQKPLLTLNDIKKHICSHSIYHVITTWWFAYLHSIAFVEQIPEPDVSSHISYLNLLFDKSCDLLYNGLDFNVIKIM